MARPRCSPAVVASILHRMDRGNYSESPTEGITGASLRTAYHWRAQALAGDARTLADLAAAGWAPPGHRQPPPVAPPQAGPMPFADFAALAWSQPHPTDAIAAALEVESDSPFLRRLAPGGVVAPTLLDVFAVSGAEELAFVAELLTDTDEDDPVTIARAAVDLLEAALVIVRAKIPPPIARKRAPARPSRRPAAQP